MTKNDRPITPVGTAGTAGTAGSLDKKYQLRISSIPEATKAMLDEYVKQEGHANNAAAARFILHQFLKDYKEKNTNTAQQGGGV